MLIFNSQIHIRMFLGNNFRRKKFSKIKMREIYNFRKIIHIALNFNYVSLHLLNLEVFILLLIRLLFAALGVT